MPDSGFAYAQARLQARYGSRPTAPDWQRLTAIADFRSFLDHVRATRLAPWVVNISPLVRHHELERLLRAHLRARISEVAGWVPPSWRAAVRWVRVLVDLPALAHLLRHESSQAWMLEEDALRPFAAAEAEIHTALLERSAWAALARDGGASPLAGRWLKEWWRRVPPASPPLRRRLEALAEAVQRHRRTFIPAAGAAPVPARAAWEARRRLETTLVRHFRDGFEAPSATFAFLLLTALEYERLRGELVSRLLFTTGNA